MTLRDDVPRTRRARLQEIFRDESNGGLTVIAAAIIAVIWASSPWSTNYNNFISTEIGTASFHLSFAHWVSDLLLAFFFFVVGVELRHEISYGSLSSFRKAVIPTSAALGGMAISAIIFYVINLDSQFKEAWAIPISTDIAFALALLAVVGKKLSQQLRVFLLTVAVVNDLAAITVIALFYGETITWTYLITSIMAITVFALIQRSHVTSLAIYIPVAGIAWYSMYQSGVHATVAGVLLGLVMRNRKHDDESFSPAAHAEHVLRPFTAGFCVPMFALVTAGISVTSLSWSDSLFNSLALGIFLGLILGQPLGVLLATRIATMLARTKLPAGMSWLDVWIVGLLAAIGFTVALLVSEVSFADSPEELATAKLAILLTNVIAMGQATIGIQLRTYLQGKSVR
jgi:NhaA family Na+:H+ antiporter